MRITPIAVVDVNLATASWFPRLIGRLLVVVYGIAVPVATTRTEEVLLSSDLTAICAGVVTLPIVDVV